jgi:TetR/AcrR family tetracycline transcriptional repressor
MADTTAQGNRVVLDRERLVHVALELLDEVGLDELSMRRLAERLGVTAAALYWYVRDKNELLGLLADAISAEMPLPAPDRPWRSELEALARGARRVALAHRDVARILVATLPTGPHRLHAIDAILGLLTRAGFSPTDAADAAYVLTVYGVGFMLDEALGPQPLPSSLPPPAVPSIGDAPLLTSLAQGAQGRLVLERGAVNLTIRSDAALLTLYQLAFEGHPPAVETRDGTVRIRQQHGRRNSCDLTLAGAITWEIVIDGGAVRLSADLRALRLASLHVSGGVNQATMRLPHPSGTIPLRIDGGVNRLRVERPSTSGMRLYLNRGSSHITLDGVRLRAVGGGTDWASPDYATTSDRYHVEVGGGASDVSVTAIAREPGTTTDTTTNLTAQMGNWFAAQPPNEYPNLVALADHLANADPDRRFEVGLQIVLDGLERRLAGSSGRARL